MKVNDFSERYQVYYSAQDRVVKHVHEQVYEVYHITIGDDNQNMLSVSTVDFNGLDSDEINEYLADVGLVYLRDEDKIVQKHDQQEVIADNKDIIDYILADRLSISGHQYDTIKFEFTNTNQLNELLLEHDIPIKFSKQTIEYL